MNFVQVVVGLFLLFIFLCVLFVVAWYIALPIFLVIVFVSVVGHIWQKVQRFFKTNEPIQHLKQTHEKRRKSHDIIDVEYTEL